ncbi:SCO3933 family regulatory protein [Kineococcus terrestris]|uniref:SCO3933 family regulatory protein n=1 Tax=Kineococcus terrestris TaxID=2044856 RepID=UPI003F68AA43
MRIKMDTTSVRFMVTRPGEAKVDRETGQERVDRSTGALLWQVQVMALDESGGEILTVTIDSEPKIAVGEFVRLDGLVAIPWSQGDRSGVAFRASGIAPVKPSAAAA